MYFGMKYSMDGVALLFGMKIGTIKLVLPLLIMAKDPQ